MIFVNKFQLEIKNIKITSPLHQIKKYIKNSILLRKIAIIETINDELKNLYQVEHTRHRSVNNFIINILGAIYAYSFFPKKTSIESQKN